MIFTSPEFIYVFFPFVFILYYILNYFKKYLLSKWFLVIASICFYAYGSLDFTPLFILSITFNYLIGRYISSTHEIKYKVKFRKIFLISGIFLNLFLLGYYKYTNFFLENVNFFSSNQISLIDLILPIGISFFTFQLLAYLIDSYEGKTKDYKFLDYLLFITFFPQLIVGPIVHHSEVVDQFESEDNKRIDYNNLSLGFFIFFMGAAKKLILADSLTDASQNGFNHYADLGFYDAWICALGYTISYYFDLSGYSDMAVGLGLFFNIKIPGNFDSPYKASNFADYWRRWHITLSRFLGDYIFRSIFKKGDSPIKFYTAVMITFFVSGFWHGAGYNFIVWGILNGILVCISHFFIRSQISLPYLLSWSITFVFVILARVLFVSVDLNSAFIYYHKMFTPANLNSLEFTYFSNWNLIFLSIGIIICLFFPNSNSISEKFKYNKTYLFYTILLILIVLANIGTPHRFLYFQF
jgi:alginate O-acetyltransferase complex protein AlgI